MPRCYPAEIDFRDHRRGERAAWEALRAHLPDEAAVFYSVRVPDGPLEREIDFLVALPGAGLAVIEVKGGGISRDDQGWWSWHGDKRRKLKQNPMEQAEDGQHALHRFLEAKGSPAAKAWTQHLVVLPHGEVPRDYDPPDFPRRRVIDKGQFDDLVPSLFRTVQTGLGRSPLDAADIDGLADLLVPVLDSPDAARLQAAEHEARADQLAQDNAERLDMLSEQTRFTVIGGAGTGKTWMAMEQARRLANDGQRVALLCYSRGLGRYLQRQAKEWRRQPAYVGLFHDLALAWGAPALEGDPSAYYEEVLPLALGELAAGRPEKERFDAVVVDEAQDFGELWWPSLLACLKDKEGGGVFVFMDEDQRVFHRQAAAPLAGKPLVLRTNFRNTKQIAQVFGSLAAEELRAHGRVGPRVRFVRCPSDGALGRADDAVDALLDVWEPGQVALLTTKHRHPVQKEFGEAHDAYWASYFDGEDVFYGTVGGFKGLERTAVVLAVNGFDEKARAKEMLYVGLSRARSQLVVVGDLEEIARVGGEGVRKRLEAAERWVHLPPYKG